MLKRLLYCASFALFALPSFAQAGPSPQTCETRANTTSAMLLECIQSNELWQHLSQFQVIADENPGPDGHGNRNTGTKGYLASVNYVAGLMRAAGYTVTIQPYEYKTGSVVGTPQVAAAGRNFTFQEDFYVARLSAGATISALSQSAASGCSASDFAGFSRGRVALLERGECAYDKQVDNAERAGAAAAIIINTAAQQNFASASRGPFDGTAFEIRLTRPARIPVLMTSHDAGEALLAMSSASQPVRIDVQTQPATGIDYNVIADSRYGNPDKTVVVEGHLDAIFGAGMLDNASGSTTILEIALNMANTPTRNHLRYIWFGGEELGLWGSAYYTTTMTPQQKKQLAFDVDADVTATPNFDYLVADPANAYNVKLFPKNVVPESRIGNQFFYDYFKSAGVPSRAAGFGNDGTDSNSFSLIGIPNTGVLTQQDCCKGKEEVAIWGGYPGNYEGDIPSFNGGCVDMPYRWCDNLPNNDPTVFELVSKATAYTVFQLAGYGF